MPREQLEIMRRALLIVEAVPRDQDGCWPGDGPAHDDNCGLEDHSESVAAVTATEGITWDFVSWSDTAIWFRRALHDRAYRRIA